MRRGSRIFFLWCYLALVASFASPVAMAEAEGAATSAPKEEAAVHIVYTERPEGVEPEAYHVRTLVSVLGSEEAAKEALVYSYRTAASGFSAKLTPQQVAEISRGNQPHGCPPDVFRRAPHNRKQLLCKIQRVILYTNLGEPYDTGLLFMSNPVFFRSCPAGRFVCIQDLENFMCRGFTWG